MATIFDLKQAEAEAARVRDVAQQEVWARDRAINDQRRILEAAVADYHDAISMHGRAVQSLDVAIDNLKAARAAVYAREEIDRAGVKRIIERGR